MSSTWWCEAYGPPTDGVPAEHWPRCFFEEADGRCSSPAVCADVMAAERHRVFARMNELAVDGDSIMQGLADYFSTPGRLLGGPDHGEAPG